MSERAARSRHTVTAAMLVLTFTTGVVDAVGFLGLDRVFAGNMTGNVVILGMGVVGAADLPVLGPAAALVAFLLGAAVAGRVLRHAPAQREWHRRYTVLFAVVATLLAATTAPLFAVDDPGPLVEAAVAAGLATAMGLQAGTARRVAVADVTTVVVTSTLTGLAADSPLGSRIDRHPWGRRVLSVTLIAAGAAVGAALLRLHPGWGIVLAATLTLTVAVAVPLARRRGSGGPERAEPGPASTG